MREALNTHRKAGFVHNFPTGKNASEQDFSSLSTDIHGGYYYYLYIKKTRSPANHTTLSPLLHSNNFGLSNLPGTMKDFQLKKMRATT